MHSLEVKCKERSLQFGGTRPNFLLILQSNELDLEYLLRSIGCTTVESLTLLLLSSGDNAANGAIKVVAKMNTRQRKQGELISFLGSS